MKKSLSLKASSFTYDSDLYMPPGFEIPSNEPNAWRAINNSITCILVDGARTGYAHVGMLEQYNKATGILTGATKINSPNDNDYIPNYLDNVNCPPLNANNTLEFSNETDFPCMIIVTGRFSGFKVTYNCGAREPAYFTLPNDTFSIAVACEQQPNGYYGLTLQNPLTSVIDNSYLVIDNIKPPGYLNLSFASNNPG